MRGSAGEDLRVAGVRVAREAVEALPAGRRRGRVVVEEDHQVTEDVQGIRPRGPPQPVRARISATIARAWSVSCGVTYPMSAERATSRNGHALVREGADERLALRRPGRDRGALDAEVSCPRSRCSAACRGRRSDRWRRPGSRRRPPSCPTAGAPPRRSRRPRRRVRSISSRTAGLSRSSIRKRGNVRRPKCAASFCRADDLDPQARPAGAHIVEGGDRLGDVERLGVGGDHGRHQPDVPGQRGDAGGDEHGVQPAADLVGAPVGLREARGLEPERVLDGHEVEQAALGLGDEVGPVLGGEQVARAGPPARARRPGASPRRRGRRRGASEEDSEERR